VASSGAGFDWWIKDFKDAPSPVSPKGRAILMIASNAPCAVGCTASHVPSASGIGSRRGTGRQSGRISSRASKEKPPPHRLCYSSTLPHDQRAQEFKQLPQPDQRRLRGASRGRILSMTFAGLRAQVLDQSVPLAPPDIAFGPRRIRDSACARHAPARGAKVMA